MKKVLIIDSHNMLHRARFGFGEGPHKIYFNFFRMLKGEMKNHDPDIVYVVDEGRATISKNLSSDYKANRKKLDDPNFGREKDEVFDTIKHMSGLVYMRHPERECDDVIGHLASKVHQNDAVVIVSTDSDFIQLINSNVGLWHPKKKQFVSPWYCDYLTWKALRGDASDNISGVSGIGPKRADSLASDAAFLESFLSESSERREQYELSKALIKLKELSSNDLQVFQSELNDKILLEEFQKRNCKSIIGKAWPKWVSAFQKAGEKYAPQSKESFERKSNAPTS